MKLVLRTLLHNQMTLLYYQTFFLASLKLSSLNNEGKQWQYVKDAVYLIFLSVAMNNLQGLEKKGDKILSSMFRIGPIHQVCQ